MKYEFEIPDEITQYLIGHLFKMEIRIKPNNSVEITEISVLRYGTKALSQEQQRDMFHELHAILPETNAETSAEYGTGRLYSKLDNNKLEIYFGNLSDPVAKSCITIYPKTDEVAKIAKLGLCPRITLSLCTSEEKAIAREAGLID